MTRKLFALALLAWLAPAARSQDMPLSQILIEGEGWKKAEGKPKKPATEEGAIDDLPGVYAAVSHDNLTLYAYPAKGRFIEAATRRTRPAAIRTVPYRPLRTKAGEAGIAVTGLATDREGRIYAATEIGVQVFDPTGRLCGVLTPAAPGLPSHLTFEGDQLTMWIGDTKYTRKLNTRGVK